VGESVTMATDRGDKAAACSGGRAASGRGGGDENSVGGGEGGVGGGWSPWRNKSCWGAPASASSAAAAAASSSAWSPGGFLRRATPRSHSRGATAVPCAAGGEAAVVLALTEMFGDGVLRDMGAAAAAGIGAYLWVKLFSVLGSKNLIEPKLSRKLIHVSCGPFFMLTWPLFSSMPEVRWVNAPRAR